MLHTWQDAENVVEEVVTVDIGSGHLLLARPLPHPALGGDEVASEQGGISEVVGALEIHKITHAHGILQHQLGGRGLLLLRGLLRLILDLVESPHNHTLIKKLSVGRNKQTNTRPPKLDSQVEAGFVGGGGVGHSERHNKG